MRDVIRFVLPCLALCLVAACGGEEDADGDGFKSDVDCNDNDPAVHPEAAESCNEIDDNCDGDVDNDPVDGASWVADSDGDTFGTTYRACEMPSGITTVTKTGDCKDDDVTTFPGSTAKETPGDGVDTDCDGNDYCTDLNCDGLPDVVLPSHHDGDYAITQSPLLLSGSGGWTLDPTPIDQSGTLGTTVADFNKDGYVDIVHASYYGATAQNTDSFVYWGPDHTQAGRTALPTIGAHWPCVGDLDDNGFVDLVFTNNTNGSTNDVDSYIYWNRGGAFSPTDRLPLPTRGAHQCSIVDLEDDGFLDILISNYVSNQLPATPPPGQYANNLYIYHGDASHTFSTNKRTSLPTIGSLSHVAADLDGDGRKEIVAFAWSDGTTYKTSNNFIYWNGTGGFAADNRTALAGSATQKGLVKDLNGDGFPEIVIPGYYSDVDWATMTQSYIYWGASNHQYSAANRTTLTTRGQLTALAEDVNGDDHLDLILPSHWDGDSLANTFVFFGTAGGTYNDANHIELPGYQPTWGTAVADFDHDGFKDIFLPGYHHNITGADMTPWANIPQSRIYWGSTTGIRPTFFDQWPSRGAWSAVVVGK